MDRVGARGDGCSNHRFDRQIALRRRRGADDRDLVGHARGQAVAVRLRRAKDCRHPQPLRRADDAQRDLAAVGDEQAPNHARRISAAPFATIVAFSARISPIVPAVPALTGFISFMVSMMPMTVSGPTLSPTSTNGGSPGEGAR